MKKVFLFIMLLCCSIVFTGCGNSNSYDGSVKTVSINVDKNVMNKAIVQGSSRAVETEEVIYLKYNDEKFDSYRIDKEGNYIFSKVMYESVALNMVSGNTRSTIIIYFGNKTVNVDFQKIDLPKTLFMKMDNDNNISMYNDEGNSIRVYYVNGEKYGDEDEDEITSVKIEKYNNYNTKAKVTFYNYMGESKEILKDYELNSEHFDWKISAIDEELNVLRSWKKSDNDSSSNLEIIPHGTDGNKYYEISLTELGKDAAPGHDLSNTRIMINYIKYDGLDIVNRGLLEATIYRP